MSCPPRISQNCCWFFTVKYKRYSNPKYRGKKITIPEFFFSFSGEVKKVRIVILVRKINLKLKVSSYRTQLTYSILGCSFFLQLDEKIWQIEVFVLSILILRVKESQTLTTHDIRKTKGLWSCVYLLPKNKLYEIHRCSFTSYTDKLKREKKRERKD